MPTGAWLIVDDHEIVDAMAFEQVQNFHREFVLMDRDGIERHQIAHEAVGDFCVGLEVADEIAVGENAEQLAFFIGDDGGAGADVGHRFQDGANRRVGRDHGERVARPHDLMDAQKQAAPDHSGRMEAGEIFLLEAARFEQDHRERVAEREHDGGARGGREIQRTSFLLDIDVENDVRVLRQAGIRVAANGDDLHLKSRDGRQDSQHLFGLAAGAQGEDDVAVRDHAEIAMQRVQGIEHDGGRTGAGERRSDLVPDVPRFPHADHDDFAARFHALLDQLHGTAKIIVQALAQPLELENLDVENASGFFQVIHRALIVRRGLRAGKNSKIRRKRTQNPCFPPRDLIQLAVPSALTYENQPARSLPGRHSRPRPSSRETYRVPIERTRQKQKREAADAAPSSEGGWDVIPRAVRGGNFLQMFNPKAAARSMARRRMRFLTIPPMNANPRHDDSGKWKGH